MIDQGYYLTDQDTIVGEFNQYNVNRCEGYPEMTSELIQNGKQHRYCVQSLCQFSFSP